MWFLILVVVQDFSSAAHNAANVVWNGAVYRVMCAEHVWERWVDKHKNLFEDYKTNGGRMRADFELLKKCPLLGVVESRLLFDKLCEKFRE